MVLLDVGVMKQPGGICDRLIRSLKNLYENAKQLKRPKQFFKTHETILNIHKFYFLQIIPQKADLKETFCK